MNHLATSGRFQRAMWIIWPGFLAALAAEVAFFALFDLLDFNMRLALSRQTVYTAGFVAFWLLGCLSSALTLFLAVTVSGDAGEPFAPE